MPENHGCPNLFLSNRWSRHVKSASLHVISLARLACVHTWGWAAGSLDPRTRLAAQLQQARAEIDLLREELRIKDARRAQITAHRRPHYPPTERMIGSIRRECLDHVIVLNEDHLHQILAEYFDYYHHARTHQSLECNAPTPRAVEPPERSKVIATPYLGGLHHRYTRAA